MLSRTGFSVGLAGLWASRRVVTVYAVLVIMIGTIVSQAAAEVGPVVAAANDAPKQGAPSQHVEKQRVDKDAMVASDPYGSLLQKSRLDVGFIHAFVASFSVIIVSELGDKTFFIAAIMAMRHPRITVFLGAMSALGVMTVLAAVLGYATTIIPRWLTYYASSVLFAIFGIKMLREGWTMSADEGQEEYEEVQADLRRKDEEMEKAGGQDLEVGISRLPQRRLLYSMFSRVFLQAFTLTFLAEWGDRSQIATIILAARERLILDKFKPGNKKKHWKFDIESCTKGKVFPFKSSIAQMNVIGVIIGGTLGHSICTGLAVLGGRFIAQRISVRTVTLVGGVVFIIFAISAFFIDPDMET